MSVTLEYIIHLDDKDAVERLQKARPLQWQPVNSPVGPGGGVGSWVEIPARTADMVGKVYGGPQRAAYRNWKAEIGLTPVLPVLTTSQAFAPNCITSSWITAFLSFPFIDPTYLDQYEQQVGGFWGWLTGRTETRVWVGRFEFSPGAPVVVPGGTAPVAAIQQRKWIDGFEWPLAGEGGAASGTSEAMNRVASRHADGMGFMLRATVGATRGHTCAENGAAASPKTWERFYYRPVAYPSGKVPFWRCRGSVSDTSGVQLCQDATGRISVNDTDGSDVMTQVGATANALPLLKYAEIDVVFSFATGAAGAGSRFELWVNGKLELNIQSFPATGLGIQQNHARSEVGHGAGYDDRGLGADLDDWMAATPPDWGITNRTGNDWKNGSKMAAITATGLSAATGTYAGDWRTALQNPGDDGSVFLSTSTASDVLGLKTNAELVIDKTPGAIGAAALAIVCHMERSGTGNGHLGYSINGAAITYTITADGTRRWLCTLYRPSGALAPTVMTPLEIFRRCSADVTTEKVYSLGAVAELLGVFGQEDVKPDPASTAVPTVVGTTGIHASPYPRSAWAKASNVAPVAPVAIISGTYNGNDTGQDLVFQFPPTWLFIRDITVGTDGTNWWSSMVGSHHLFRNEIETAGAVQILVDPTFEANLSSADDQAERYLVRLVGDAANANASGKVYQYVAFCDPGQRFTVNGGLVWPRGTADRITKFFLPNFTPIAAFFHREDTGGATTPEVLYKGPGHNTADASKLDTTLVASAASFARGSITSKSALHGTAHTQIAFSAWRKNDGSGDVGLPKVVQIWSYVGTGVQDINGVRPELFPIGSGVRPLFAMIVPHDAPAIYRDPGHPGTTSTEVPTSTITLDGIQGGGIDVLYLGESLNRAGITYDVFVLPGGTDACNGGFSCDGIFVPVDPIPPTGWNGCDPITLSPATLSAGQVGTAYSATLAASGGKAPYTFAVTSGSLPDGLSLSSGGVLSGTPTSGDTKTFSVRATDAGFDGCFGERFYSISFNQEGCPEIAIAPGELPAAVVGAPYVAAFDASGGAAPYSFSVSEGSLPAGFDLSASGTLSGTLASLDVLPFTLRATDVNGCFGEGVYSLVPDTLNGGPACISASLAIVNRALSRIGITKPIVSILADKTPEATTARLNFANDVDTVLRDFPWPFATKIKALTRIGGSVESPLNADWIFSYRQPTDCVFERRLVVERGLGVDPTPPPFQLSSDTNGGLILTNQEDAVLEYTARPSCAALRGDTIFREALTWRLALSLAPALTRMTDVATKCAAAYATQLQLAATVLRPGNPGAPPADPTIDTEDGAQEANTLVANRALFRIGAKTMRSLASDQTREAVAARLFFEDELQNCLRDHPWAFATGYDTPTLVEGTETAPVNPDWTYTYRVPDSTIFVRRITAIAGIKRHPDANPPMFRLGRDEDGPLLFVNDADPTVELTLRLEGCVAVADAMFRDAFAWRLAWALAPSVGLVDPAQVEQEGRGPAQTPNPDAREPKRVSANQRTTLAAYCWNKYLEALMRARTMDAREQQQDPAVVDAPWISGR